MAYIKYSAHEVMHRHIKFLIFGIDKTLKCSKFLDNYANISSIALIPYQFNYPSQDMVVLLPTWLITYPRRCTGCKVLIHHVTNYWEVIRHAPKNFLACSCTNSMVIFVTTQHYQAYIPKNLVHIEWTKSYFQACSHISLANKPE